ncbi:hypothetical protein D8B26_007122 [Coccidioides posadasii str. Silveira]|uniref:uncharacterized protein n=1 Tax=Coccidioides posadasii (strain RMSCC 757 / Silveira) TaxID=443226 RepID=UPI001BEE51B4|nr:hypothetical protein D8B26_007122 [Coccidioides posadasii str. Silveira]
MRSASLTIGERKREIGDHLYARSTMIFILWIVRQMGRAVCIVFDPRKLRSGCRKNRPSSPGNVLIWFLEAELPGLKRNIFFIAAAKYRAFPRESRIHSEIRRIHTY